jgi:hypothetical protein
MGSAWGNAELAKPYIERHPLIQWYHHVCLQQQKHAGKPGEIFETPSNGAMRAYLSLAYHLYLLDHNASLQDLLIKRLKNRDQFYSAYYETFVAAIFIKGGFHIELEDESDEETTHCEFTATHHSSKKKYSIEAKARSLKATNSALDPKAGLRVGRHLHKALKKKANHARVVFIDLNLPSLKNDRDEFALLKDAARIIRDEEATLEIDGTPAPPAYVFLTNYPYHHALESDDVQIAALIEGFKIPDLQLWDHPHTLREAIDARDRHREITDLLNILRHHFVPSTFDGESPAVTYYGNLENRIVIGRRYDFSNEGEEPLVGEVCDAILVESERATYITVRTDDGRNVILKGKVSESELEDYRQSPSTYFGVHKEITKNNLDPVELYDFFMSSYAKTSKERLLEFMKTAPDIERLKNLTQAELARVYCERSTETIVLRSSRSP